MVSNNNEIPAKRWVSEMQHVMSYTNGKERQFVNKMEAYIKQCSLTEKNLFTNSMIFLLDFSNMKYKYISASASQVLGYTREEMIENGFEWVFSIFHPDDLSFKKNVMEDIFKIM